MASTKKQKAVTPPTAGPADAVKLQQRLVRAIPEALCELRFDNPFQLLIATILSAQSTDRTVNAVTPEVFRRWPTARALAAADQGEVEEVVKRTGFFRNKAKSIRGAAERIATQHAGEVPRTLEDLIALPGVARKTANVVLGTAFGIAAGFVVDTHVARVAGRVGLTRQTDPVKIEQDLCATFPRATWIDMGHRLLLHGRYLCLAKGPQCQHCPLYELCPSHQGEAEGSWTARADREAQRVREALAANRG